MKESIVSLIIVGVWALANSGCVTSPPGAGQVSAAYAVGDRAQMAMNEVVVSLQLAGTSGPYQNLHIGLGAIVNPKKTTFYDPYTVEQIVRRLESRIAARLVEDLTDLGGQNISGMPSLRQRIRADAQGVVDSALQQWQHGSDYQVEVVVVSLYWTDPSVGRTLQQRGWWW